MRNLLLLTSLLAAACSSPSIRGAVIARSYAQPRGRVLAHYAPEMCLDGRGRTAPRPPGLRLLVEQQGSEPRLWVRRAGYDTLILKGSFQDSRTVTFQALLDGSGPPVLEEVRLPLDFSDGGRLSLVHDFEELPAEPWRMKARPGASSLVCRLALDESAPEAAGSGESS